MSVENSYVAVDWSKFQSLEPDADMFESLVAVIDGDADEDDEDNELEDDGEDADDSEPDADEDDEDVGLGHGRAQSRMLYFGQEQDLDHYFGSWGLLMTFSEWLHSLRAQLNGKVVDPFAVLFRDVGLLFDPKTHGPEAIREGIAFSDSWLIAAISPASVAKLCGQAKALDRQGLEQELGKALAAKPCDGFPNGRLIVDWVEELHAGLSGVAKRREGLVIGAA